MSKEPTNPPLAPEHVAYIEVARRESLVDAEEHYEDLMAAFLFEIPAWAHATPQQAGKDRPRWFNADAKTYTFLLNLGPETAPTYALFKFKHQTWTLIRFISQSGTIYFMRQAFSKRLATAIFTAHEMWLEANQAAAEQVPQLLDESRPDGLPN